MRTLWETDKMKVVTTKLLCMHQGHIWFIFNLLTLNKTFSHLLTLKRTKRNHASYEVLWTICTNSEIIKFLPWPVNKLWDLKINHDLLKINWGKTFFSPFTFLRQHFLCNCRGCSGTHFLEQTHLELKVICLPLFHASWD